MTRTARLFVALELPREVRAAIHRWGATELSDPALRPVAEHALHLTLVFIGDTLSERIEPIAAAVLALRGHEALRIALAADPVALPRRRAPSLFALEVASPAAEEIQARLESDLGAAGLYEPEQRSFWPHVTVARVRRAGGGRRRPVAVGRRPGPIPPALREPFLAVRAALYLSSVGSAGTEYVPLAQVELPPSGAAVR